MERTDEPTEYTSSSPGIEELVWKARRLASERRRDMERRFEDVVEDQLDNVFPPQISFQKGTQNTTHSDPGRGKSQGGNAQRQPLTALDATSALLWAWLPEPRCCSGSTQ